MILNCLLISKGGCNLSIDIPFSYDTLDQIHLSQCGGAIAIKGNGDVVFRFHDQSQYEQFKKLKGEEKLHD